MILNIFSGTAATSCEVMSSGRLGSNGGRRMLLTIYRKFNYVACMRKLIFAQN